MAVVAAQSGRGRSTQRPRRSSRSARSARHPTLRIPAVCIPGAAGPEPGLRYPDGISLSAAAGSAARTRQSAPGAQQPRAGVATFSRVRCLPAAGAAAGLRACAAGACAAARLWSQRRARLPSVVAAGANAGSARLSAAAGSSAGAGRMGTALGSLRLWRARAGGELSGRAAGLSAAAAPELAGAGLCSRRGSRIRGRRGPSQQLDHAHRGRDRRGRWSRLRSGAGLQGHRRSGARRRHARGSQ